VARLIVIIAFVASAVPIRVVPTPPPRPRLTGLSHVALRIVDTAGAERFYGDTLGLTRRTSGDSSRITYAVGEHQFVRLEPGLPAGDDERLSHIAFETPDVKALAAYLTSNGIQVRQPADRCQDSAIRVSDPDGHSVEFVQADWPPAVTGRQPERALSNRLLHAGVIVRDEQAANRFYGDILGFSEIWRGGRTEGTVDWINMRVPDGTDYLEYMLTTAAPDRRQRGVLHHLCLRVPDIQVAWEAVALRSLPATRSLLTPPAVGRNGRWQLNLFDPDGTRTELMEPFRIR
jgi:lactoylglutathione lyase